MKAMLVRFAISLILTGRRALGLGFLNKGSLGGEREREREKERKREKERERERECVFLETERYPREDSGSSDAPVGDWGDYYLFTRIYSCIKKPKDPHFP